MNKNSAASLLKMIAVAAAVGFIVMYVIVALRRMVYPFELEWMEGGMVDHVQRVVSGLSIYAAPTIDHVAFGYPPFYYWAAAAVAQITGIGFLPLRLLSFAASLGTFLLMALIVRRETGRWIFGIIAAGTFAATYHLSDAWFDIGRVDSLFLTLVLAAIYLVRRWKTQASWMMAGLLLAMAMLTKQVALAPAAALILYGWIYERRLAVAITVSFVAAVGAVVVWQNAASGGWFWHYVIAQTAAHRIIKSSGLYFVFRGLCFGMGIALLLGLSGLLTMRREGDKQTFVFWALLSTALLGAGALPLMKEGGWQNDFMPAHLALAMLLAMGVHKILARLEQEDARAVAAIGAPLLVWLAVLIQLGGLVYEPKNRMPTAEDERTGHEFIAKLRAIPGDLLVLSHGYLPRLAGKETHATFVAITDFLSSGRTEAGKILCAEIRTAIEQQRFAAIILDLQGDLDFAGAKFEENYRLAGPVFNDPKVFFTVTGCSSRPELIYVARGRGEENEK